MSVYVLDRKLHVPLSKTEEKRSLINTIVWYMIYMYIVFLLPQNIFFLLYSKFTLKLSEINLHGLLSY